MPILRLILAIVGPLAVLGVAYERLSRTEPREPSELVQEQDAALQEQNPEVVVLGSSWAATNMDPKTLAKGLKIPELKVLTLAQKASQPPVWYAMAKYRLYGSKARPKLILVVTSLPLLMTNQPRSLSELEQHFVTPDEVLLRKVWGEDGSPWLTQLLDQRGRLRDSMRDGIRSLSVRLLVGSGADQDPSELQSQASRRVFEKVEGTGDATLHRLLPVVEEEGPARVGSAAQTVKPADSYLGDLATLAEDHGARLVVVISPVAGHQRSQQNVLPAVEAELIALANQRGVGWIDLRSLHMDDRNFRADGGHMQKAGAIRFTEELLRKLNEIGALGSGPLQSATPPATVEQVERLGTVARIENARSRLIDPALCLWAIDLRAWDAIAPRYLYDQVGTVNLPVRAIFRDQLLKAMPRNDLAGHQCEAMLGFNGAATGMLLPQGATPEEVSFELDPTLPGPDDKDPAWWVYPGTTLRWKLAGVQTGNMEVSLAARALGAGTQQPTLEMEGEIALFQPGTEGLEAHLSFDNTSTNPELLLRVPAGGPFVLIRRLSVNVEGQHTALVTAPTLSPVDLFAGALSSSSPPPVSTPPSERSGDYKFFQIPWTNTLSCSPLRLRGDGLELPVQNPWPSPRPVGPGLQHIGDRLYVKSDAEDFEIYLDEGRDCEGLPCRACPKSRWLYPGEKLTMSLNAPARRKLSATIRAIHLVGESLGGGAPEASIAVRATFKAALLLDATVPLDQLPSGVTLVLDQFLSRLDPAPLDLELVLTPNAAPLRLQARAVPM